MTSIRELLDRLLNLRHRDSVEREMDEELRFHLDMAVDRNVRRGLDPIEARRRALVQFGGVELHKEQARDELRPRWIEQAWQDLRYAARTIGRNRGFAAAVVLTLSLGIGATTAIFSVVDNVLLRPLPLPEPQRVLFVGWDFGKGKVNNSLTGYQLAYVREHAHTLEGVTTYRTAELVLGEAPRWRTVRALHVSEDFFRVFGVSPALGRAFTVDESREGGAPAIVLTDALWRTAFGGDSSIVGRRVRMGETSYTVVGIMPGRFVFPGAPELVEALLPLQLTPDPRDEGHNYEAMVRLRRGATVESLELDLAAIARALRADHPELFGAPDEGFRLRSFGDLYVGSLRTTLWVLLGAVGCVLLIACVNAANLLLARGAAREREIAVRAALGAGRGRILQQLVTEGIALALVSGALGCAIGVSSLRALLAIAPTTLPRMNAVGLDVRVLGVALTILTITGVAFGLAAARPSARLSLASTLGARTPAGLRSPRARDLLVVGETALTVVLLAGAGLLIASFARLRRVDPGFSADRVLTVRFGRMPAGYDRPERLVAFEGALLDQLRQLPSVEAAGAMSSFPLERGMNFPVAVEGRPEAAEGDVQLRAVTPGALEALRVPLLRGRALRASDDPVASPAALVSEAFARRYFPNEDPIGRRLEIGKWKDQWITSYHGGTEIVGVVGDVRDISLALEARRTVFVPRRTGASARPQLVVRTSRPASFRAEVERVVAGIDSRVPPPQVTPLGTIVGASLATQRFETVILTIFAASALLLTSIGVFGLLSYTVHLRQREIGLRMALGARSGAVFRQVVGRGMARVAAGGAIGVVAALWLTRFLDSLLYGVAATDVRVFAAGMTVLGVTAFVACAVPARRAARVDPMIALRG